MFPLALGYDRLLASLIVSLDVRVFKHSLLVNKLNISTVHHVSSMATVDVPERALQPEGPGT